MSDFRLINPEGWEYDLQSVYSAYIGSFQLHNIQWYDRTWGQFFETFEQFLGFSWPVITVTDSSTGRPHIVTRINSIGAFIKMIKTRFGETLPTPDNMLVVSPFETAPRHLRNVADWATYKKLYTTLPAVALAAFKTRVRAGELKAIRELWAKRDKTFLAIDFESNERNPSTSLQWGYAAVRCGHLEAIGAWPPVPETNYRKGHYIIGEYADKIVNRHSSYPWQFAFGDSQTILKAKLPQIVQSVISSLASPATETTANTLVLVGHSVSSHIQRLEEIKIKIPHNVLIVDTAAFERALFNAGERGPMHDPITGKPRVQGPALSLGALLHSLGFDLPYAPLQRNAGNDAFLCLLALQKMLDPATRDLDVRQKMRAKTGGMRVMSMVAGHPGLLTAHMGIGERSRSRSMMSLKVPEGSVSGAGTGMGYVRDGSPDEMGVGHNRASKYRCASPLNTDGNLRDDKEKEKEKDKARLVAPSCAGIGRRLVTK